MTAKVLVGDCRAVLATLEPNSIDACVTDPPYGLEFMGKDWDKLNAAKPGNEAFKPKRPTMSADMSPEPRAKNNPWQKERSGYGTRRKNPRCYHCGRLQMDKPGRKCECAEPYWNPRLDESAREMQAWHETWAREVYRVLKPGAHLLAFSGTRTSHRMVCALEDAGFEIRDCLMYLYGSGFPKSLDVSKAIDKAAVPGQLMDFIADVRAAAKANGYTYQTLNEALGGQAVAEHVLKPSASNAAWPTRDTYETLKRVLGIGNQWDWLYADVRGAERPVIGRNERPAGWFTTQNGHDITTAATDLARHWDGWGTALKPAYEPIVLARKPLIGSVARNISEYGTGGLNIDATRIHTDGSEAKPYTVTRLKPGATLNKTGGNWRPEAGGIAYHGETKNGRWPANVIFDDAAAALLDAMSGERTSPGNYQRNASVKNIIYGKGLADQASGNTHIGYGDTGGASRFFYTAKSSRAERNKGLGDDRNGHPCVKPVDLMQWLCRLVCPKGGTILDPFMGSGSTGIAADREGFDFIGIEQDESYARTAELRIRADCPLFAHVSIEQAIRPDSLDSPLTLLPNDSDDTALSSSLDREFVSSGTG